MTLVTDVVVTMVSDASVRFCIREELLHGFDEPTTVVDLTLLRFLPQHAWGCVARVEEHVRVKVDHGLEQEFHRSKWNCACVVPPLVRHALHIT